MPAAGADSRQRVEGRRVGVKDPGSYLFDDIVESPIKVADDLQLAKPRQPRSKTSWHWGAQEFPPADPLARGPRRIMLATRQQHGLPPQRPLLIDDAERAKRSAAAANGRECAEFASLTPALVNDHAALCKAQAGVEFPPRRLIYF